MTTTATDHAQALIRCASITPIEGGALRYLERVLKEVGFETHFLTFTQPGTPDVDNLYARIGTGAPHVCFAGHTDVVPPGDSQSWTYPPFSATIYNGVLYGRGASDMKGGVAATLAAALDYVRSASGKPVGSISFLITGDEEGPSLNGTKKVVNWLLERGERPDCCILAECTSETALGDTIKIGRRGSLSVKLTLHGVQGHVAYPHKSKNPLPRLLHALTVLTLKRLDDGTEHFQPSHLEITSIDTGNPTHNIIPAKASAHFNIRFNDTHTGQSLKDWIDNTVKAALFETGVSYTLDYEPVTESFMTTPAPWVQMLKAATHAETGQDPMFSTSGGTSDARFIKDLCPVVEIGLLNKTAHKVDECAAVDDIEALSRVYLRFLHMMMSSA